MRGWGWGKPRGCRVRMLMRQCCYVCCYVHFESSVADKQVHGGPCDAHLLPLACRYPCTHTHTHTCAQTCMHTLLTTEHMQSQAHGTTLPSMLSFNNI